MDRDVALQDCMVGNYTGKSNFGPHGCSYQEDNGGGEESKLHSLATPEIDNLLCCKDRAKLPQWFPEISPKHYNLDCAECLS